VYVARDCSDLKEHALYPRTMNVVPISGEVSRIGFPILPIVQSYILILALLILLFNCCIEIRGESKVMIHFFDDLNLGSKTYYKRKALANCEGFLVI